MSRCEMQDFFTFSKLYDYSPKLDNFEKKTVGYYITRKLELQATSVNGAVKSYYWYLLR